MARTKRLTRFELLRYLGHGGMAETLLARTVGPEGFEKLVVLKKIVPQLARDPRHVRLFLDEARLAACLDHPNIVHVHDLGLVDDDYCYAMEYVHGATLSRVIEASELPIGLAVHIACALASALHYAHERRGHNGRRLAIVHRDVSPSNVVISYDGVVKLIDFGIAKATNASIRTMTGVLKGKPGYLAPEQGKGASVDRRADIYALGAVLWEMLTGLPLSESTRLDAIVGHTPTAPSKLRRGCPRELDAIVLRALAHEPERRFQTACDLQRALEELARSHRLEVSALALADHMQSAFAADIRAWSVPDTSAVTKTDLHGVEEEPTVAAATRPYRITKRLDSTRSHARLAMLFVLLFVLTALVAHAHT